MVRVIFTYFEDAGKWEAHVEGAKDAIEARQGFSAVVLTCRMLPTELLTKTIVDQIDDHFLITPAV